MEIKFRPHHFLCAFCFKGKGYSKEFIANFKSIMQQLNSDKGNETLIHVTNRTDDICHPCPHRTDHTCTSETQIKALDEAHANALKIKVEDKLTWRETKKRIQENISLNTFHEICSSCSWKKSGICEEVLINNRLK